MGKNNIAGAWGEERAAEYLRKKHYTLVAAGYYCKFGEIDLIVKDRKYLVFVEVKLRKNAKFAQAHEFVDRCGQPHRSILLRIPRACSRGSMLLKSTPLRES